MIIGITGSLGTGKSTVAAYFKALGAELIDADIVAHGVIQRGTPGYRSIVRLFGKGVLSASGTIDRKKLGKVVFEDRDLLNKLNNIVHPEVIRTVKDRIAKAGSKTVIFDAPLLIEAGLTDLVDLLIVVKASKAAQVARISKKSGIKKSEALARIRLQMPLSRKIKMADIVIDNGGSKIRTKKQVVAVWKRLAQEKSKTGGNK